MYDFGALERSIAVDRSHEQPTRAVPDPAGLLSLLCIIASSVLTSSARSDAVVKGASVPDPPELAPEDDYPCSSTPQASISGDLAANKGPVEVTHGHREDVPTSQVRSAQVQCEGCAKKQNPGHQTTPTEPPAGVTVTTATAATIATAAPTAAQISEVSTPSIEETAAKNMTISAAEQPVGGSGTSASSSETPKAESVEQPEISEETVTSPVVSPTEVCENEPSAADRDTAAVATRETSDEAQGSDQPVATSDVGQGEEVQATGEDSTNVTPAAVESTPETVPTEEATTTDPDTTNEAAAAKTELELPEWFLGNNVILHEDLLKHPSSLELVEIKPKPINKGNQKTNLTAAESLKREETDKVSSSSDSASAPTTAASPSGDLTTDAERKDKHCTCVCKIAEVGSEDRQMLHSEATPEPNASESAKATFQLHREMYDEALDMITPALQPYQIKENADGTKEAPPRDWVTMSSFLFQSPKDGSLGFLDEVMRQLGRDTNADLITIGLEDLEDLCQHFWNDSGEVRNVAPVELTSATRLVGYFFGHNTPDQNSKEGVACILKAAERKTKSATKAAGEANPTTGTAKNIATQAAEASLADAKPNQPLDGNALAVEILQTGVKNAFDSATLILQAAIAEAFARALSPGTDNPNTTSSSIANRSPQNSQAPSSIGQEIWDKGVDRKADGSDTTLSARQRPLILVFRGADTLGKMTPLRRIAESINDVRREEGRPIILIGTAVSASTEENKPTSGISKVWEGLEIYESCIVNLAPRNTRRAAEALKQHGARVIPSTKWRLLRRAVRVTLDQHPTVSTAALYPSGPPSCERVVDTIEDEKRRQMLSDWDQKFSERVVRQVSARAIKTGAVTPLDIFEVMQRVMRNKAIFDKMNDADDDEFVGEDCDADEGEVQFGGPIKKSNAKTLLDSISAGCSDAEKEYFDCVVDTESVSSTAQGIHMDQSLIDSLKQLLNLRQSKPYGLLAKEAVNGAILYGPPGTGKTHLARVVAASAGTNLIVATPADIQNMWVGETEKRIKALFSLGTKLAPCVIFLDEGDSVFGKRSGLDHDWQRKAMSQFLMEMDGLVSRKKAPFLMVATNRPGDIDDAVCRRLPHTLHIGMPTAAGRRAILDIYLKDERLEPALDLDEVASDKMTKGFSGSDIRTLCVQAAMVAHKALEAERCGAKGEAEVGGKGSEKRVITKEHFRKALERTRPSVTTESLLEIERFVGQNEQGGYHQAMYI